MIDEVMDRLLELEKENEQLEDEMASPNPVRLTEYIAAGDSPGGTLRTIARIAESLSPSIGELAGDKITLPTFY
jgi:hypothetical protein